MLVMGQKHAINLFWGNQYRFIQSNVLQQNLSLTIAGNNVLGLEPAMNLDLVLTMSKFY